MTVILGINAYHGDSSACVVVGGVPIAAVEEERFTRTKHWAGFPIQAIEYCLREADVTATQVDHVALSRQPTARLSRKAVYALRKRPNWSTMRDRLRNMSRARDIKTTFAQATGTDPARLMARFHGIEHHRSHSASAFFVSPFEQAAVVSVDAMGDFRSTLISDGAGNRMEELSDVGYPHSLGIMYTAVTQYLGFQKYGDEYKVMGLAAYGEPTYLEEFRKMVAPTSNGRFELNTRYFIHYDRGVAMTWDNCEPEIGAIFSDYMAERLGPMRQPGEEVTQRHMDIAASLQAVTEEIYFHILRYAHEATQRRAVALAGGVAFNSVANGKVMDNTPFEDIYIQPAAGDAGTAMGAAYGVWHGELRQPRGYVLKSPYLGPEYDDSTLSQALQSFGLAHKQYDEAELIRKTAEALAAGQVVGWFQGRCEFGPRALGNRSILADPRRADMKERINAIVKRRESFRPFAPSILVDAVGDYFERSYPDPFMIKVYEIKKEKRGEIPAVTHVDGTGRLQSVSRDENPRYWKLINEFYRLTGVPILLNTSFNESEPIVTKPEEAIACFLRTNMDVLVMGNNWTARGEANPAESGEVQATV